MRDWTMKLSATLFSIIAMAIGVGVLGCDKPASNTASPAGSKVKIGYLVKQPDEPWFQTEWAFAQKAADENGFELIKIGTTDGEKALAAIDNLAANGAKGFVICTPDTRLGPAIVAKAKANDLKLMTVDDQFVGSDGKVMADVHHLGVAARDVGHVSGQSLMDEFKKRKWPLEQTAACIVTFDELDTAHERTEGIIEKLIEGGFPKERIFRAPQKTTDIPGSFDAANVLLTQHGDVKNWLVAGMNDTASLGAVRALEGRNFNADNAIAIGINGTDCIDELRKPKATGFYGSMFVSAPQEGRTAAEILYHWIKDGTQPPLDTRTKAVLITRENFQDVLHKEGIL